jgi:hypothetical protein
MGFVFSYIKTILVEREKETHKDKHMNYELIFLCQNGVIKLFPSAKHFTLIMVLIITMYQTTISFFNHRFLVKT